MPSELQLEVTVQFLDVRWKTALRPYCKTVRSVCHAVLDDAKLAKTGQHFEMAVVLADDAFIRDLNHTWRGMDKPTNVLSFPSGEKAAIGDIILAFDKVAREAKEQGKSVRDHAIHLLVHGTLHLLGYDHIRESDAKAMEAREIKILKKLDVSNPYL